VSKNDNCHCAGTTNVAVNVWEGTPEEESLETALEHIHRGFISQTVPFMGSSNREGPITDVYCLAVV